MTNTTRPRIVVSARVKILAWVLITVLFAAVITVLATHRVLISGVAASSSAKLSHEAAQFHAFVASGDPATGEGFTSLETLFEAHLAQQLPETDETFFTLIDGEVFDRSSDEPPIRIDRDPRVLEQAAAATAPVSFREETAVGPTDIAVIPVEEAKGQKGALVMAQFLGPAQAEVHDTIGTLSTIAAIALGFAAALGWIAAGRVLAPIRTLRETADSITENDLSRRIQVKGNDDVAQLATTFNGMLDRLETAFEGQRRFLDDAGHELRTPITVVRGHLELIDDDPRERAETLRLVNDELVRMGRLVDDLTLLAKSERPDFLRLHAVGLTDLVVDALTHASTMGQRNFLIDELPEGSVVADEQRLLQVFMQLVSNAVKYTQPGDTIALGGSVDAGQVKLWVRDTGVGIAEHEQGKLFERFNRGSQQAGPAQGIDLGFGIGLEIVARIAEAHGGTIDVSSVLGEGATFTLTIPHVEP